MFENLNLSKKSIRLHIIKMTADENRDNKDKKRASFKRLIDPIFQTQ